MAATGVVGLINETGGDSDRIFGAARLNIADIANPSGLLDLRRYCNLFEQAARQTGVDSFGLRFGSTYKIENMGALGTLVLNAPTLAAALNHLCRYFPVIQEHSTLALRQNSEHLHLEYHIRDGRITQRRQDAELSICIFTSLLRHCLGSGWSPEEIHFEHPRAASPGEHEKLLNAPVYFAQTTNAIMFRRGSLNAAMPNSDFCAALQAQSGLHHSLAQTRPEDFAGKVAHEIRLGFSTGDASIGSIAKRLGMSSTTLYRQLTLSGEEFSRLTQTIRQELALSYVAQSHIPLTEIAQLLGYSELSAFSRAFRRWTGMSPESKRKQVLTTCG